MAEPAKKIISKPSVPANEGGNNSFDILHKNYSKELVLAFCGAVGAGIDKAKPHLERKLKDFGYKVQHIKISELLVEAIPDDYKLTKKDFFEFDKYKRYFELQELGNHLREKFGNAVATELAIRSLAVNRRQQSSGALDKVAFIVDQLKHPDEAKLLRLLYQDNFYLIGTYAAREQRRRNLIKEGISQPHAETLIERDRADSKKHGQQLDKTFHLADYFVVNEGNADKLRDKVDRLVELVHGSIKYPPSIDERSMYAAYSASLNSICLSRQVGASIVDKQGNTIATGFNDAPKFGGGLYSSNDKEDNRCVFKNNKCSNDNEKINIKKHILKSLTESSIEEFLSKEKLLKDLGKNTKDFLNLIVNKIYEDTKLNALTEFSRAIHAEMEALLALSRTDSPSSTGATLYTTTYPCHNCARHIVAAGIERVVFIEPYEKSMAISLHDDAISETKEADKVSFESFQGVSPRSFNTFFERIGKVKDDIGLALEKEQEDRLKITSLSTMDYTALEKLILANITSKFETAE